jgi:hypothetical protein
MPVRVYVATSFASKDAPSASSITPNVGLLRVFGLSMLEISTSRCSNTYYYLKLIVVRLALSQHIVGKMAMMTM